VDSLGIHLVGNEWVRERVDSPKNHTAQEGALGDLD
jgi:hypothetical protein